MSPLLLTVFAALIGVAMGFLFAVSGFGDPGKVDTLSANPRVKNFLWVIGGAVSVFLADWKILLGGNVDPGPKAQLVLSYSAAAVATAIVVVLVMSLGIFLSVRAGARRSPWLVGQAGDLVLEYLTFGFRAYRARRDRLGADAAQGTSAADALSGLGSSLSVLLSATALDRSRPDRAQREVLIDQALTAIEKTVQLFAAGVSDLDLKTNYMARVDAARIGEARLRFAPDPPESYDSFLVLRRYRDQRGEPVCIPVAKPAQVECVLPGAPMAVAEGAACLLDPRKLSFRAGVKPAVRADIKAFFKDVRYLSVLSVPLIWDRAVVGVVNVESNNVDLVGKGSDMTRQIAHALAPHCVILGELVSRNEE